MRFRHGSLTVLAALVSAAVLLAGPPEVPPELTVGAGKIKEVVVKPDAGKDFGFRLVGGNAAFREMKADDPAQRVFWLIPETDAPLSIVWWTVGEKASAVTEVNKGGKPPVPPGPTPPGPNPPGPNPPGPTPTPPAPINADGLHVLVVFETAEADKLTRDQLNTIFGQDFYDLLNAKCPLGPDGKKHTWRVFDKDTPTAGDDPVWADAMKRQRTELPWVIVSNPQKGGGFEGPLPKTKADILALVTKFGG